METIAIEIEWKPGKLPFAWRFWEGADRSDLEFCMGMGMGMGIRMRMKWVLALALAFVLNLALALKLALTDVLGLESVLGIEFAWQTQNLPSECGLARNAVAMGILLEIQTRVALQRQNQTRQPIPWNPPGTRNVNVGSAATLHPM